MKKQYISPEIEIIELDMEDIIRTSGEEGNKSLTLDNDPITIEGGDSTIFNLD